MRNSLEIIEERNSAIDQMQDIVNLVDTEKRSMTEEETSKFNGLKTSIDALDEELRQIDVANLQSQIAEKQEIKINNRNENKMKHSIVKEIREAMANGTNKFVIESRDGDATPAPSEQYTGNALVEEEYKELLEPLYANSVLAQLGVKTYSGLPMGDVVIPVMSGKSNVGWEGELDEAASTKGTFTSVKLTPHRLTAYMDISKLLIAQDTMGIESALRRDIVKALNDKLESTILGAGAGDSNTPAGIFNGVTETTIATYADLCNLEAALEENNASGEMKYAMSPKFKAYVRQLAKSAKSTELVFEGNAVDGTPAISSSLIPSKKFIYGNFNDVIVAQWDQIEVVVDPYSAALKGCIRLVINAYYDCKVARTDALKFGNIA